MPPTNTQSKKHHLTFSAALKLTPQQDPKRADLTGHVPPVDTLDPGLKDLKALRQLSLSTNAISSIQNIPENLQILSLGRNAIKRLEGPDGGVAAAAGLEEYVGVGGVHEVGKVSGERSDPSTCGPPR